MLAKVQSLWNFATRNFYVIDSRMRAWRNWLTVPTYAPLHQNFLIGRGAYVGTVSLLVSALAARDFSDDAVAYVFSTQSEENNLHGRVFFPLKRTIFSTWISTLAHELQIIK